MINGKKSLRDFFCNVQIQGAININDRGLIESIIWKPSFPWFISFPRTGSHWVRMIMELYFEKPSLVEVYYYKDVKEFTCYHRHDVQLTISGCINVLYLYRNPVDTVYSQLKYNKENVDNKEKIQYWAEIYGKHLSKWLFEENFTTKKTIISYEGLQKDIYKEFEKICNHFDKKLDKNKLEIIRKKVTKNNLKQMTLHDKQVVDLSSKYETKRIIFKENHANSIINYIKAINPKILDFF